MAEQQCVQARQAVQKAEQAKAASTELQAQLARAEQALHSQQQFALSLQAAAAEAAQGIVHSVTQSLSVCIKPTHRRLSKHSPNRGNWQHAGMSGITHKLSSLCIAHEIEESRDLCLHAGAIMTLYDS